MQKIKNVLSTLLLIVTFVLLIVLIFTRIQGETPRFLGYQLFRVSTPSMSPTLQVGDIIISKCVDDVSDIKVGDVITYRGEEGNYAGKTITHEVVCEPFVSNGVTLLQTKGIANSYSDPLITDDQVIGVMVRTMPLLSAMYSFFMTPWGLVGVLGLLAVMFINELFTLKALVKENRESDGDKEEEETSQEEDSSVEDSPDTENDEFSDCSDSSESEFSEDIPDEEAAESEEDITSKEQAEF